MIHVERSHDMYFEIKRIQADPSRIDKVWAIMPLSGVFEGSVVAHADGVCMSDVLFHNKALSGLLIATWGLEIDETVYRDIYTLRGLKIGKTFDMRPSDVLTASVEGYLDRAGRVVREAQAATVIGDEVYIRRQK